MNAQNDHTPMPIAPFRRPLVFAALIALLVAGALASTATAAQWGQATPTKYTFTLTKRDQAALKASQRAERMRQLAAKQRTLLNRDNDRIFKIQQLLDAAQGDEARLRAAIQARLVERYEQGGPASDVAFLMSASGAGDAVTRAELIQTAAQGDRQMHAQYQLTVQRLQDLEAALTQLRDDHGVSASTLDTQAGNLDAQLVGARSAHVDASESEAAQPPAAAAGGTWLAAPGVMTPAMLFPTGTAGPAYAGGTLTPARPSTAQQVAAVLADTRVDIYPAGRQDIATGRVDGRVLDALELLANQFGTISVTSLISGHGIYTTSGNISEHAYGCAADIGSVAGTVIQPSTQGPGTITEQAVTFLAALQGDLAPHQVISLNSYGGPTMAMADHYDHIHLGYHC